MNPATKSTFYNVFIVYINIIILFEVQNVLDELVADGLLEVLGESKINWPNPTSKSALTMEVYRKLPPNEVDESKLLLYGVTKRSYLTSYKQKTSKFTSQLNKLCEEID